MVSDEKIERMVLEELTSLKGAQDEMKIKIEKMLRLVKLIAILAVTSNILLAIFAIKLLLI